MGCALYLVRHGIAENPAPGRRDFERRLTPDGARKIARAARGLRRLGVHPDLILASPLPRAVETAQRIAEVVTPDRQIGIYQPLAPGHTVEELLAELALYRDVRRLMLVGHQPTMSDLASVLLTHGLGGVTLPFETGSVAAIGVDAIPPRRPGFLRWFLLPRQLRAAARRP